MSVLVAGTIAIDDVKTPAAEHKNLLGGSASYAAIGASFFAPTRMVGIVGEDFPDEHMKLLKSFLIDTDGVEVASGGSTFRWSGEYFDDLNTRETRDVKLNVIENYKPKLPQSYASADQVLMLANMSPVTQMEVLDQCDNTRFVIADTMDLWIDVTREALEELLQRIDLLVINDSEARQFAETTNVIQAGHELLKQGPKHIVIKKGEHGALLFSGDNRFFSSGAYPLHEVHDPTGAGDAFVGALAGYLASGAGGGIRFSSLCRAMIQGSIIASFNCESFSTRRLESLDKEEIARRHEELTRFTTLS